MCNGIIDSHRLDGRDEEVNSIDKAKRLGTFGKPDRSKQYDAPEELNPVRLRHAINCLGIHVRTGEAERDRIQHQLMNLKLRNGIVIAAVTAALTVLGQWLIR